MRDSSQWRPDRLTRLTGSPRQQRFMAFDTEDDQLGFGRGTGFYLGCVHDGEGSHVFTERRRMLEYLCSEEFAGCFAAAHNLEYDLLNLFGPKALAGLRPIFSGSKLCGAGVQVKSGKGRRNWLHFWDTSCFMPESLKALAPLVGLEKLDAEHHPGDRRVTPGRRDYCRRDAEIVYKLCNFIQEGVNALGAELKLTAAATSMDCFRRRFQHEDLPCLDKRVQVWLHGGYYGGRTECFRLGEYSGEFHKNDVNGAYVSVMINSNLPSIANFVERSSPDFTQEGMADCDMEVPEHLWVPPLPVRGEKLLFPVGRLRGLWTYNEIRAALNLGCQVRTVRCCWHSSRGEPYLREMMQKLRAIREDPGTPAPVSKLAKLLGNSLYGKFAQRNEEARYYSAGEFAELLKGGELRAGRDFDPEEVEEFPRLELVRVKFPVSFPAYSNVIWSACITAGCRNLLYPHLSSPGGGSGEESTYYCDTDSLLGTVAYPRNKLLGSLSLEKSYSRIIIRGNKLYAGQEVAGSWEAHAKGVPRDLALSAVESAGTGHRIESRRPVKFRTALRGKELANHWGAVHKVLSGSYEKRRVLPDGRTEPLVVKAW